ncbi:MAG: adenylate cyclase [Thiotrichales bacterium]|nr:MAG: adenylate cyclase [Thiotrichales bacterium]
MAIEIERKFLLKNDNWKSLVTNTLVIKQGYLQSGVNESHKASVRIRISNDDANINIKSINRTMVRQEYEYSIPLTDAKQMLATLCDEVIITKTRYHVPYKSHLWEVDIFEGCNFNGRMEPIAGTHLYTVSVTMDNCNGMGTGVDTIPTYTGLISVRGTDRLILVLTNGAYDFSGEYKEQ